jgi:thiol:disulfide interchange protein DsbA
MKKLTYALLLYFSLMPGAGRADYTEGVEYTRLPQSQPVETGSKIEVREIFWYGCSHCYNLEPAITKWLKTKPANAQFVRMPAILGPSWEPHARAFYAFEALGVIDKLHSALFNALHAQGQALNNESSIAEFVAKHGVDKEKFLKAYNSFSVDAHVKNAVQMALRYGIEGVPTLIVDGKFKTSSALVGGPDRLMQMADYLVKKSAAERKKPTATP